MNLKKSGTKFKPIFIMAHGAGAPMDSDWMNLLTDDLVSREIQVIRFEFPYMEERRLSGRKRPPNTQKVMLKTWMEVIKKVQKGSPEAPLYIGGKSMGGRMASLVADLIKPNGLIALGFPFHAPGKEPGERIEHLKNLKTKCLIIQGSRDSMGTREECLSYPISNKLQFLWLEDGDHSWKPRKKSGYTIDGHRQTAADAIKKLIG